MPRVRACRIKERERERVRERARERVRVRVRVRLRRRVIRLSSVSSPSRCKERALKREKEWGLSGSMALPVFVAGFALVSLRIAMILHENDELLDSEE